MRNIDRVAFGMRILWNAENQIVNILSNNQVKSCLKTDHIVSYIAFLEARAIRAREVLLHSIAAKSSPAAQDFLCEGFRLG